MYVLCCCIWMNESVSLHISSIIIQQEVYFDDLLYYLHSHEIYVSTSYVQLEVNWI